MRRKLASAGWRAERAVGGQKKSPDTGCVPGDRVRPARQDYAGAALSVRLSKQLTAGLKGLSGRQGTTLYMTLLAGWAALLGRLSGQA